MLEKLKTVIRDKAITTVFQPIFNIERSVIVGYEALSRGPENSELYWPETLFDLATRHNLLSALEILCRDKAISQFAKLKLAGKLYLNISPMVLLNSAHPQGETIKLVEQVGLSCQQIVIEISEKYPFPNSDILYNALAKYRKFGFDVAIDDLGAGYSGLKQWSYLRPDIVKIDRYFIDGCDKDILKREFLRTLFDLGRSSNAQVIAEGIETKEEYELLRELGMVYAQGYFLARPEKHPVREFPKLNITAKVKQQSLLGTVANLVIATVTAIDNQSADDVYRLFIKDPALMSIPVIAHNRPIGIVYRNQLMELYSDIYGRALFCRKNVVDVMDSAPMIIEHDVELDQASNQVTQLDDDQFSQSFIVVKQGFYLGMVSIRELLKGITASKLENARYANPLTLLPGNVLIDTEIDYLLNKHQPFSLAYIDINHFKPFNDIYGYAQGDFMLKTLADSIIHHTQNQGCFVGHIGGDDFIVLFKKDNAQRLCQAILDDFAECSLSFFERDHLTQQGYFALNRSGERVFHPLVSLAVGLIQPDVKLVSSHHQISRLATDAKAEAKKAPGNSLFICRRKTLEAELSLDIEPLEPRPYIAVA